MIDYIKNTYYGKNSFIDTLIFFGIFGLSFFVVLLLSLCEQYSYYLATHQYLLYFIISATVIYTIFLSLSLYRSAKNNKKICYVTIAIEVSIVSLLLSYFLSSTYNPNKIFESAILSMNKNLPQMIDKNIRFDKITIENSNILYKYTVLNAKENEINKDLFTLVMTDKIERNSMIDKMLLKLSKKQREINYIFTDRENNFITKVKLKNF